jgi:hypothetical protein
MAVKSFLSWGIVGPILIVVAFLVGRFTASWPSGETRQPVETGHPSPVSTAKAEIPPGKSVVGFLDMVNGNPVVLAKRDGEVQVSGWAACVDPASPLSKVEVLVDGKIRTDTAPSYARPDVMAAYGRPDFEKSGWKASFSAHGIEMGEHALKAIVTCSKGEVGVLPSFRLTIANQ